MNKPTNPFDLQIYKTERTANQKLVEWINQIVRKENLSFGQAEQETKGTDRKSPDIILLKKPKSKQVSLTAELKPPYFDPLDYEQVKEPARKKANIRKSPYFATSNFKRLYLFSTEKANKYEAEEKQLVAKYELSQLEDLESIDDPVYKNQILKNLTIFLRDLEGYVHGKKTEEQLPLDEWLILRLQEKVAVLTYYYKDLIEDRCWNDKGFRRKLSKWFNQQGWNFVLHKQDFVKAARHTAYLLVNKILFYDALRSKDPQNFPRLHIPDDFTKGRMSRLYLQNFYNEVLRIDYETIYSTDFMDEVAFPDNRAVINEIRELIDSLNRFNFAEIEYEILGRIFEGLIPAKKRRILGQYFTHQDIVDLILGFCIKEEKDKIFDPGCGAGTFLRRAYNLKKLINPAFTHEKLLPTLWGNDISKFPASLATINLALADLTSQNNYPRIVQKDFFDWLPGNIQLPEQTKKVFLQNLGDEEAKTAIPKYFDAIVGNPPYTRQEEMDDLVGEEGQEYKDKLIGKAVRDEKGKVYANLSKRAGLHAYFFVHGTKFLKNGGRFGFIVSNSWLDVDYGAGLQEHFLQNYKIRTIVESKVERWFADADVNTCIVLLEKCAGESKEAAQKRNENIVRFAYLKKPLSEFIPKATRIFEETVERKLAVEILLQHILGKTKVYDGEDLRVYPIRQKELWEEGFDEETQKYVGAKWGKYIRAPKIFFTILEKAKDKLVPLKEVAEVKRGITTGVNKFFYLTEEEIRRHGIEKEFWMHKDKKGNWIPNYVVKSPRECKSIVVNPENLKYRMLIIHKDRKELKGTNVLAYIKRGESNGYEYHKRPTCVSRKRWWDLGKITPYGFLHPMIHYDRQVVFLNKYNVYVDHNLFEIKPRVQGDLHVLFCFFASTIAILMKELGGRVSLGQGALKTEGIDLEKLLTISPASVSAQTKKRLKKWIKDNSEFEHRSIFDDLSANNAASVKLQIISSTRRELDKIIMGNILGLTEEEQLEVYKAVIDLVKTRLEKAKSVKKNNKTKSGIDISLLVKTIVDKAGGNILGRFYKQNVLSQKKLKTVILPTLSESPKINLKLTGYELQSGKEKIEFATEEEAIYCKIFLEAGWQEVEIPENSERIIKLLQKLEKIHNDVQKAIAYYTEGVLDQKLEKEISSRVWQEVSKL